MHLNESNLSQLRYFLKMSLAVFERYGDLSLNPPLNREAQHKLVAQLARHIEFNFPDFKLDYATIDKIVQLKDPDFKSIYSSSYTNLAWLLCHEGVSRGFPRFAVHVLGRQPYFLHQLPKAGSTSINVALERTDVWVTYRHGSFEEMTGLYGLLGFSNQAWQMFQGTKRTSPITYGGHYNLSETVTEFDIDLPASGGGISIFRHPEMLIESALRYEWQRFASHDAELVAEYDDLDAEAYAAAFKEAKQENDRSSKALSNVQLMVERMLVSQRFVRNYAEPLIRYYLGIGSETVEAFQERFLRTGAIKFTSAMAQVARILDEDLGLKVAIGRENVSDLTHSALIRALGGTENAAALFRPLTRQSIDLYEMLREHELRFAT